MGYMCKSQEKRDLKQRPEKGEISIQINGEVMTMSVAIQVAPAV